MDDAKTDLLRSQNAGKCLSCGGDLDRYGPGATKRFLNRGATAYYCTKCLAERLKISHTTLMEKIEVLRSQGCTLFP
ncbi:MAG: hypothetical protein ACI3YK_05490 [Eubacteriales bacterium]